MSLKYLVILLFVSMATTVLANSPDKKETFKDPPSLTVVYRGKILPKEEYPSKVRLSPMSKIYLDGKPIKFEDMPEEAHCYEIELEPDRETVITIRLRTKAK